MHISRKLHNKNTTQDVTTQNSTTYTNTIEYTTSQNDIKKRISIQYNAK